MGWRIQESPATCRNAWRGVVKVERVCFGGGGCGGSHGGDEGAPSARE